MKILSIETSCDETGIAILDFKKTFFLKKEIEFKVLSNQLISQANLHKEYGGVYPNLAKREHVKNIVKIFEIALKESNLLKEKNANLQKYKKKKIDKNKKLEKIKILLEKEEEMFQELKDFFLKFEKPDLKAIAVTAGPGLAPALWVGINFAKALSLFWNIKIHSINHMEGHVISSLIEKKSDNKYIILNYKKPALALLISGGHTEIIYFEKIGKYKKIGETLDDAVGEAFDKIARSLNLPYPGGPEISKIAESFREKINEDKFKKEILELAQKYKLPRAMINSSDLNFSFSGIKTSVINNINKIKKELENWKIEEKEKEEILKKYFSWEFENCAKDILIFKTNKAISKYKIKSLLIGGGVIANKFLRKNFIELSEKEKVKLYLPEQFLTGDNAFMIGGAAIIKILKNKKIKNIDDIKALSNWNIENI